jgi:uncharacterized membrane protein
MCPFIMKRQVMCGSKAFAGSLSLVAGFCFNLSHKHIARAVLLIGCGTLITLTTILVTPDNAIIFGVLFFLGFAILVAGLLKSYS